jgi:hypothetical protein
MTIMFSEQRSAYCSVDDVRAFGITEDMQDATDIDVNILRAAQEMDAFMQGTYLPHTVALWLDGNGKDTLLLPDYPVRSIQVIRVDDEDLTVFDESTGTGTVRIVDGEAGIIKRRDGGAFTSGDANIYVEYTAGYDPEAMPGDLRMANAKLAAAYTLAGLEGVNNPLSLSSISEGALNMAFGGSSQKIQALTAGLMDSLIKYRRVAFAGV